MIHVCTLKYGTKYSSENVNSLYNAIKRDCKEFNFHCLTDDKRDLNPEINVIKFEEDTYDLTHWNKLRFYNGKFIEAEYGDEIVILDIDQTFIGDSSKIVECPVKSGEHLFAYRWWSEGKSECPINAGTQKFLYDGSQKYILDKFLGNPDKWLIYYHWYYNSINTSEKVRRIGFGEQNFIFDNLKHTHTISYFPKQSIINLSTNHIRLNIFKNRYYNEFSEELIIDNKLNQASVLVHCTGPGNDVFDMSTLENLK
jgi:hypothetical protein